ncbi:MAG: PLDc N-terminal domain-containing protein [Candidatus Altiarchaeota archaeon]
MILDYMGVFMAFFLILVNGISWIITIIAVIDILKRDFENKQHKVPWIIGVVFLGWFGVIAYYVFVVRKVRWTMWDREIKGGEDKDDMMRKNVKKTVMGGRETVILDGKEYSGR